MLDAGSRLLLLLLLLHSHSHKYMNIHSYDSVLACGEYIKGYTLSRAQCVLSPIHYTRDTYYMSASVLICLAHRRRICCIACGPSRAQSGSRETGNHSACVLVCAGMLAWWMLIGGARSYGSPSQTPYAQLHACGEAECGYLVGSQTHIHTQNNIRCVYVCAQDDCAVHVEHMI